jgi:hypothetical protein
MLMNLIGRRPEKGCAGDAQQELYVIYRPEFSSERAPHINKSVTVALTMRHPSIRKSWH